MGFFGSLFTAAYLADQELNRREDAERHRHQLEEARRCQAQLEPEPPNFEEDPDPAELDPPTASAIRTLRRLLDTRLIPSRWGRSGAERADEVRRMLHDGELTNTQANRVIRLLREYPARGTPPDDSAWSATVIDIERCYE